jgi:hypothetical protein
MFSSCHPTKKSATSGTNFQLYNPKLPSSRKHYYLIIDELVLLSGLIESWTLQSLRLFTIDYH